VPSLALTFVIATALTAGWLSAVTRWTGRPVRVVDLTIIAALCCGLALLPGVGIALAAIVMALLVTRVTDTDTWPAVLMIVGSGAVWLPANVLLWT
jgi:hypothetical protein